MIKVITYVTYDLLHYCFINLLRRARALGDYLIVALSTDEFNQKQKQKKCYFSYEQRKQLLEAIRTVTKANIIGADLNELAPTLDTTGVSTATACKVLRETLIALDKGWPGFQV